MKKLIITGSGKLFERAIYWRGYFEGRGYEVIDWPTPITDDPNASTTTPTPGHLHGRRLHKQDAVYNTRLLETYHRFWTHLSEADVLFIMNEDKDGIPGYIGYGAMAEMGYFIIDNYTRRHKTKIYLLNPPSPKQGCFEEVQFWLDRGWVSLYQHPKNLIPLSTATLPTPEDPEPITPTAPEPITPTPSPAQSTPAPAHPSHFSHTNDKMIDLTTSKHRALRPLSPSVREYLKIFSPTCPAWLLKYIAAPEFQRLKDVGMTSMDYSAIYNFQNFSSVFQHSIGVALIIWHFTHDKIQTLAGLFHDISSPSFKHAIDYLNGDSERQESIEARTGEIIRNSRAITRQLKKDGILPSEVSDYKLFPIADNDIPGLAADRLEYTFSNGYFLYDTWNLTDVKRFYDDITILRNEAGISELGFQDAKLAAEFTSRNLPLCAHYHSAEARASLQFFADILRSMFVKDRLTPDDLYTMTEREIIDWVLGCGDHTLTEAFRNFQRTTTAWSNSSIKKGTYHTAVKAKTRYIDPLISTTEIDVDGNPIAARISTLNRAVKTELKTYLATKQPRFVGFDFDFKPYAK